MSTLNILHISDIHFDENTNETRDKLLDSLIESIEKQPIDLICFTGDITQSAETTQFDKAKTFFENLNKALPTKPIFIIPGNHDYNYAHVSKVDELVSKASQNSYDNEYSQDLIEDAKVPLNEKFKNFHKFLDNLNFPVSKFRIDNVPNNTFQKEYTNNDNKLLIIGLNTSIIAKAEHLKDEKVKISIDQLKGILKDNDIVNMRLLLAHHPLGSLNPNEKLQFEDFLLKNNIIILSGHQHIDEPDYRIKGKNFYFSYISNCLFAPETDRFQYQIIEIDFNKSKLYLKKFLYDKNYDRWVDDGDKEDYNLPKNLKKKSKGNIEDSICDNGNIESGTNKDDLPPNDLNRYWCSKKENYKIDYNGYIAEPSSDYSYIQNTNLKSLNQLNDQQCLILLGTPDIGKTYTLENNKTAIISELKTNNDHYLWKNIQSISDYAQFEKEILNNDEWSNLSNDKKLYIYIDGISESLKNCPNIIDWLISYIKSKEHQSNIFLRLTMRTIDWSISFEDQLSTLYTKDDAISVYELVPFAKKDVMNIAKENNIENLESFFETIDQLKLQCFAILPKTLKHLIYLYKNGYLAQLNNQKNFYINACMMLCDENNFKISSNKYASIEKLTVATKIATFMKFTETESINLNNLERYKNDELVYLEDLIYGSENIRARNIQFTKDLLLETFNTGLFIGGRSHSLKFINDSIQEFLTAYYLSGRNLNA